MKKFRIWDIKNKKFDNSLVIDCEGFIGEWVGGKIACSLEEQKDYYIIQQYTGLVDDNGVRIYEGNIEFFDQLFAQQARIVDNVVLTENEREMILKSLISIKDKLYKVDPKSKTYKDYNSALKETENLIKKI